MILSKHPCNIDKLRDWHPLEDRLTILIAEVLYEIKFVIKKKIKFKKKQFASTHRNCRRDVRAVGGEYKAGTHIPTRPSGGASDPTVWD